MSERRDTQEFRDDIIAALQTERDRCAQSRFRRTLEYQSRVLMLDSMLAHLRSNYDCELEIGRVHLPGEIRL